MLVMLLSLPLVACKTNKTKSAEKTGDTSAVTFRDNGVKMDGDFGYTLEGDEATLCFYSYKDFNQNTIALPDTIGGHKVVAIGTKLFEDCSSFESITLPSGLKTIGTYAFVSCTGLKSVTIPEGVTEISEGAFKYCTSLEAVYLSEGIKKINDYAFAGCKRLVTINLNAEMTITSKAFTGCDLLKDNPYTKQNNVQTIYGVTGTFPSCKDWTADEFMTEIDGEPKKYECVIKNVPAGTYSFKVRANEEWTDSWGELENGKTYDSQINCLIDVEEAGDVYIKFDTTDENSDLWKISAKVK